jgi:hypothetical protein
MVVLGSVRPLLTQVALAADTELSIHIDSGGGAGFATLQIAPVEQEFPRLVIFGGTRSGVAADLGPPSMGT